MSNLVIQNKFDGGHAEDIRTFSTDECEKSLNFDIFTNPHRLIPHTDSIIEALDSGNMFDIQISDVDIAKPNGIYRIVGAGYESSSSTKTSFYRKSSLTSTWAKEATTAAVAYQKGSGVTYKDIFYALSLTGGVYTLDSYDGSGSTTVIGTITSSASFAKLFVHPQDDILYIVTGNTIATYDGTTFSTPVTTILPSKMTATSITDYGSYLAIAMTPLRETGNTTVYLWGRDMTLDAIQGNIDFGEGNLLILENLGNNLIAVMQPTAPSPFGFTSIENNRLVIKGYFGGAVQVIKSLSANIAIGNTINKLTKVKNGGILYFGLNGDDCVYAFGKNKSDQYAITKDKYYFNGVAINSIYNLSIIGTKLWTAFVTVGSVFTLMRSRTTITEGLTYASTSVYKTTINPSMPIADRYKDKQLDVVQVSYTGKASGTIVFKYSVDGSSFATAISETTTAIEDIKESNAEITTGIAFLSGREFQFQMESTGGVEIKEFRYRYTVKSTII